MNFVLGLLGALAVKTLYDFRIVGLAVCRLFLLLLFVAVGIAGLKHALSFGCRHGFIGADGGQVFGVCKGKVVVLQFFFDIELVELIIDGIVGFLGD